jgi:hypothetical protein
MYGNTFVVCVRITYVCTGHYEQICLQATMQYSVVGSVACWLHLCGTKDQKWHFTVCVNQCM